ncbi:hypothetical protein PTSG_06262 [Salpingoeca rosetta]|uniref:DUF7897 domain-containing protein n=1 Tax=Salpingoeca rosetta (strain ATCC 50818 / BSB-021) TaxID=946362 RepID=F2UCE4_SALR5|nr:uncharacterized protein PTSG_06262 [Salpingoeca rosetta]EGD74251.1 hypothetical protein PTSG_06262 [Salpingoeca rosetta]|eukprot:XP_004993151.1 hypothetical protein PTSG_06262 [Salpingoeca rosetta]
MMTDASPLDIAGTTLGSVLNQKRFDKVKESLTGLSHTALFKKLAQAAQDIFVEEEVRQKYPAERHAQLIQAVRETKVESCGSALSPQFREMYTLRSAQQDLLRDFVLLSLEYTKLCGFSDFEKVLLKHCMMIAHYYDRLFLAWSDIMQHPDFVEQVRLMKPTAQECFNPYTIVSYNREAGTYATTTYAAAFPSLVSAIVEEMTNLCAELNELSELDEGERAYVPYFRQYITCLKHTNISTLESEWLHLDALWMKVTTPIQVVHDLVRGLADPLRAKIPPDFSIRIRDDSFVDAQAKIATITESMKSFYSSRNTPLGDAGAQKLDASLAGFFIVPVFAGLSLHTGLRSLKAPANQLMRNDYGIKLLLDFPTAGTRLHKLREHILQVVDEPVQHCQYLDALTSLVWNTVPHELSHTAYNLTTLDGAGQVPAIYMLEEVRASLAVLHNVSLQVKANTVTEQGAVIRPLFHDRMLLAVMFSQQQQQQQQQFHQQQHAYEQVPPASTSAFVEPQTAYNQSTDPFASYPPTDQYQEQHQSQVSAAYEQPVSQQLTSALTYDDVAYTAAGHQHDQHLPQQHQQLSPPPQQHQQHQQLQPYGQPAIQGNVGSQAVDTQTSHAVPGGTQQPQHNPSFEDAFPSQLPLLDDASKQQQQQHHQQQQQQEEQALPQLPSAPNSYTTEQQPYLPPEPYQAPNGSASQP